MCCSLNSVDPAICLGSQDMCFLIREPGFTSHTLTLSRKLQLQCLLCFAYQKPRLFQFPALQPPVPICLWKFEGSALAHLGWGCSWGLCRAPGCCCGGAHIWGCLWGKKLFNFSCSKSTTPIFYPWAWLVTPEPPSSCCWAPPGTFHTPRSQISCHQWVFPTGCRVELWF